jgi:ABC-type Mn2+/Zn2+ transport system ATPase subunit
VVFCSHDLRVVSSICDRVACLNVTLHYHDVPDRIPQQLAEEMFGGVWEGLTLRPHVHGPGCCPA